MSCHKFNGTQITIEDDYEYGTASVQIINKKLFPFGPNPCLSLNCSQFCLIEEGGMEEACHCRDPYKLSIDNQNCELDFDRVERGNENVS